MGEEGIVVVVIEENAKQSCTKSRRTVEEYLKTRKPSGACVAPPMMGENADC